MSFQWTTPPDQAWPALASEYRRAIELAVYTLAQRRAPEIEAYMKSNAPWIDRTANARQTLTAEANYIAGQVAEIVMEHGVYYGWYLEGIDPETFDELRNGGKYAIIGPAIDYFAPIVWRDIRQLLRP